MVTALGRLPALKAIFEDRFNPYGARVLKLPVSIVYLRNVGQMFLERNC